MLWWSIRVLFDTTTRRWRKGVIPMKTMMMFISLFFLITACETVPLPEVSSDVELKTDVTVGSETSNIDVSKSDATTIDVKQCLTVTIYHDADKDSWGDKATAILHCADQPLADDWTLTLGDCDDKNPSVHPGTVETCNYIDDNCNGETDESCVPPPAIDAGSTNAGSDSSEAGEIDAGSTDSTTNSSADTAADSIDSGTDATSTDSSTDAGTIETSEDATSVDVSQDATSIDTGTELECLSDSDCNVSPTSCPKFICITYKVGIKSKCEPHVFKELCNGIDDDCNGITDDATDPKVMQTYYEDKDSDGCGNPNKMIKACAKPVGYVVTGNDCDDDCALCHPTPYPIEFCDNKDNDCDGLTDEGVSLITHYPDTDNDGFGTDTNILLKPVVICVNGFESIPSFYVSNKDDCNDKNPSTYPGAIEKCDYKDNDCDGQTDEDFGMIGYTCGDASLGSVNICSADGKHTECSVPSCDPVACATLAGKCESGVCITFCESCKSGDVCEDTNKDGLGDKCSGLPIDMQTPFLKNLDNYIVVVLPNVPSVTIFDYGFQTYKTMSEIGTKWTSYDQWVLGAKYFLMNFLVNGDINTPPNGFEDPEVCGIRFNADIFTSGVTTQQKNPQGWLCEGNGATVKWFDKDTRFFRATVGVIIEVTKHVQKWSAPGGTSAGCSALLPIKTMCPD